MVAGFRSFGGTSKACPHPAKTEDGSGWNLALPRIRQERMKLAKFKPAKMPIKMELRQLGQHFFENYDHGIRAWSKPVDRVFQLQLWCGRMKCKEFWNTNLR